MVAGDPGRNSADWVRKGALAGIVSQPLLAGVFLPAEVSRDEVVDPADLWLDPGVALGGCAYVFIYVLANWNF